MCNGSVGYVLSLEREQVQRTYVKENLLNIINTFYRKKKNYILFGNNE